MESRFSWAASTARLACTGRWGFRFATSVRRCWVPSALSARGKDQISPAGGAPFALSGSRWSLILYLPPYGLTGWGNLHTGHGVVLRALTLHLPTNLPPPLHSEVIYRLLSACEKSTSLDSASAQQAFLPGRAGVGRMQAELVLAECRMLMADKLPLPLNNLGPSDPTILLQILPMLKRPASRMRPRPGQPGIPVSIFVGYLGSLARSHAARSPVADQFETRLTPGQWL